MRQDGIPLREVRVRTVRPDEEPRWNDLMREHHYLGFRNFCGNRLRQVSLLAGTILQSTKLPIGTWFLAIYLLAQAKNGISTLLLPHPQLSTTS